MRGSLIKFSNLNDLRKMSSTTCRVAVLQMTSTSDKVRNRQKCEELLRKAKNYGAQAAFLPEAFDFIGESTEQTSQLAEHLNEKNGTIENYQKLASELTMSLSLGGFHERLKNENTKLGNTHVMIG